MLRTLFISAFLIPVVLSISPSSGGEDRDGQTKSLQAKISDLQASIEADSGSVVTYLKRNELGGLAFEAAQRAMHDGADRTQAEHYFRMCTEEYEFAANQARKLSRAFQKSGQSEKARDLSIVAGRMFVKAGISRYFWKQLLKPGTKQWTEMLECSRQRLFEGVGELSRNDPVILWAWLYDSLAASELGADFEAIAHISAVLDRDKGIVNLETSLGSRSDAARLIRDPVEGLALAIVTDCLQKGKDEEALSWAERLAEITGSKGVKEGPLGARVRLECYDVMLESRGTAKAAKSLVEAARPNAGNAIGRAARPMLEELVDGSLSRSGKRYAIVLEAAVVLGDELRMEGLDSKALERYKQFFDAKPSRSLLRKYAAAVLDSMGRCYCRMERWEEAAKSFEESCRTLEERGKTLDAGTLAGWHHALTRLSEKTGSPVKGSADVRERMISLGLDPDAPWPETGGKMICPDVSFPPTGLINLPEDIDLPILAYRPLPTIPPAGNKADKKLRQAAESGLDWLARHQDPSGYWNCAEFMHRCKGGPCSGPGNYLNNVGVTGLATLTFLEGGSTVISGPHKDAVRSACRYLCSVQSQKHGCLVPEVGTHFMYNHAIGTLALVKAYQLSRWPVLAGPAHRAIEYIHGSKNPGAAWRYNDGETDPLLANDVSVTGWMIQCLAHAHHCGLPYERQDLIESMAYIDSMTSPKTGRTGYREKGQGSGREADDWDLWPFDQTEAMTGVGMVCRCVAGEVLDNMKSQATLLRKGSKLLASQPPCWDKGKGCIDFYYWYYGTRALDASHSSAWDAWKAAASRALLENQEQSGCRAGSWDPAFGPWGDNGGRVYSTALNTMNLLILSNRE